MNIINELQKEITVGTELPKFSAGDKVKFFFSRNAGDIHGTIVKVKINVNIE